MDMEEIIKKYHYMDTPRAALFAWYNGEKLRAEKLVSTVQNKINYDRDELVAAMAERDEILDNANALLSTLRKEI